jgi:hypothetical protein
VCPGIAFERESTIRTRRGVARVSRASPDCLSPLTIETVAGSWVTVSDADPVTPCAVAVIVVDPTDTAVASPVSSTVATAGEVELHVLDTGVMAPPPPSRAVAENAMVCPIAMAVAKVGLT